MKCSLLKTVLAVALFCTTALDTQAGWIKRYIYRDINGTLVTNLFGTNINGIVVFPNSPDTADTQLIPPSSSDPNNVAQSLVNWADNYGSWTPGYIEPPETGNYTFWVCGDDETQLWLTSDPTDPLNSSKKQMIATVPGWSNAGEWTKYPEQQSIPIYLEKGKQYYMEALHKEGTGGDNVGWAWQLPSGGLEQPMRTFYLQPTRDAADPIVVDGPFAAPISPVGVGDPTIYDGMEVMLFANLNLVPPYTVAWYRGSTAIPGANQTYYRFRARTSDNNAQFSIRVNGTLYGPFTLSVFADVTKPELVSAIVPTTNPTQVQVVFSELVTPDTATNLANYTLSSGTVQSAQLQPDGRTVLLKTPLLLQGMQSSLTISGIQDWASPANTMLTVQTNLLVTDQSLTYRIWYSAQASSIATLRTWSATNSTAAAYTNNAFNEERIINTTTYGWNLIPLRDNYAGQLIGYITAPETGNYRFGIASDDQSVLYLGTTDQRSSKREICYRDGSTGQWNLGVAASQVSAYIRLEAGKRYYIEAVYRDGTGGDGVTVAWEKPSDTAAGNLLPTANQNTAATTQPFLIPTNLLSSFITYGNVILKTNLPATFSAAESTRPTLRVAVDGTRPYTYQWFKNDTLIAGAGAAAYTLPYVRQADNNATFYAVVNNSFSSVTSVVAKLTVTTDTTKPTIASVGSVYKQTVELRMSEPVTGTAATNLANYLLLSSTGTPVTINAAVQDTNDAAHITLQTAPLPETDLMKLVVQNMADLSAGANVMNPQTNTFRANNFDTLTRINNSQTYTATASGDQIQMTAGGSDIWGTADQLAYLSKTITGNFDYKIQGVSLPTVNQWCKMGLMARNGTANGARNAFTCFTPLTPAQNTYSPQVRDTTGGATTATADVGSPLNLGLQGGVAQRPNVAYPSWLRLQRVGDALFWYYGTTGTNWTLWTWYDSTSSPEGPLPATLQFGLALTSHDTGRTVDGVMAGFTAIDDGALRFTLVPTNAVIVEGANANFSAAVAGRSPWLFQWLKNNNPIDSATNATLTLIRVPLADNDATITCRVTNPYGETVTASAKIIISGPDVTKPSVASVGSVFKNTVEVYFTEGVTTATANNLANYTLRSSSGATIGITSAIQDSTDITHVTLTTAAMPDLDLMQLSCASMIDLSVAANVMDLQTNAFRANNFDALERINNTQAFSARADGERIYMTAGGSDIWGTSDQCAYLYKTVSGNFDIKVQGISIPAVNSWSKMGLMARTGVDAGAINCFSCFTPSTGQNTYSPQVRTNASGTSTSSGDANTPLALNLQAGVTARPTVVYPSWVRIQRINDTIYYYYSTTGTNWTFWTWWNSATTPNGPLPADMLIGLAITSHDTGRTVDGVMASFSAVNDGPLRFTLEPVSTTIGEGANVTFTAAVAGRGPYFYQWTKNDANIANATGTALALTAVPFSDNGARYACKVTNPYGDSITSSNAVLTVIQDNSKPVAYAVGSLRGTSIGVYFDDSNRVDPLTATNPANYIVNDGAVSVSSVTLEPDGLAAMLALSAPISGDFSVRIQNIKDGSPQANVIDPVTLQSTVVTWPLNQDVGSSAGSPPVFNDPIMPGFAQAIGSDGIYVHAGGSDIWNQSDAMHFVYQAVTGDFDVAVRVTSIRLADVWSKAGLMFRTDLAGTSRNYLIAATPTNGQNQITMQWRTGTNIASASLADALRPRPSPLPNAWLRMTRAGQVYSFYWGTNGTDWVSLYTTNEVATPWPDMLYVGLATTSHNNGTNLVNTTSAYYRNLTGLSAPVIAPRLTATIQRPNLVLTWTTTDPSFKLQSTPTVTTGWADDPAVPVAAGNNYTATVPLEVGPKFYRLMKH